MSSAEKHTDTTGVQNHLIEENITRMDKSEKALWIRIPIVPEYQTGEEIKRMCEFLSSLTGTEQIELLPFHRYGENKYEQLGMKYALSLTPEPDDDALYEFQQLMQTHTHAKVMIGNA
jgi:pyruvate formate lyase activating enzyme